MLPFYSIICIFTIITLSYGNPINVTDVNNTDSQSRLSCDQNALSIGNTSLFELLNNDRFWFVLARSKFIYGERTWNNVLMRTSTKVNGTTYLEFIGENSNGSCVTSEKGDILSDTESNRVSIHWPKDEGFLEMIFIDETMIHLLLCYSIDSNKTNLCTDNLSEQFIIQNHQQQYENDSMIWLKSHCSSVDPNDFIVNDNPKKCLPVVLPAEVIEVNTTEQSEENTTKTTTTTFPTTFTTDMKHENSTMTAIPVSNFTVRTNRTNRLEVLEEYYNNVTANSTDENELGETTPTIIEVEEIIVLSTNASSSNKSGHENVTSIETIVLEPVVNETIHVEIPLFELHKLVINETTTEGFTEDPEITENFSEQVKETDDLIKVNMMTTIPQNSSTASVTLTTEKKIGNESTTFLHAVENFTVPVSAEYATSTDKVETAKGITTTEEKILSTGKTETEKEMNTTEAAAAPSTAKSETTEEMTTTEATTSTSAIPIDCPALKDCPVDNCTFGHKPDNRGCPTCNCLYSNKSNIICSLLTCQSCLYGHYTDTNGCSSCQCQPRPYPPLGERCPQLNCDPCYFGTVKDEYHCDTCICIRPNNQECPILNCTFGPCKYDSVKDEDDCSTCDCLLPTINTTEVNCSNPISCPPCHLGYVKDSNGCPTCQCKLRGRVSCASLSSECQCEYGSYLNSDGCETCSCLPDPKNASHQACWELSNLANLYNISSGPKCSADGSFHARQCDKSQAKCWCVTPTGIQITGFESRPKENINCACARELYQVSNLRMIGHHLLCLLNGNYAPIQCDGRYCSCVDENGKSIGPSVSIQNRDQLRCVGVYQQLHPERFLLHRASVEHSDLARLPPMSSLCLKHLEQVRNANITDDHVLIPVCDTNGLYAPIQCDQSERYCWCVDKKTGVEMDGTRRLNARPNCNIV